MRPLSTYGVPARTRVGALASLEREFVSERASALGRAGRRLEEAIAAWEQLPEGGSAAVSGGRERQQALDDLVDATYALVVQRECAGFRINNLRWIRRCYDVPEDALRRM